MTAPPPIIEEHDGNQASGVEAEDTGADFQDIARPWDPESIRVATKNFSLRNMVDLIAEGSLDLAPDFQRLNVWKSKQKAQLIESILLQIPLPAFYFAEDTDGKMRVVDGVQRLSAINDFVAEGKQGGGGFVLDGLEYIADVKRKSFRQLPPVWQRRIFNTQIVAHVIAPSTPAPVMYDIFRRINTGGTPLNGQEIRHCMATKRSREFLKDMVRLPSFNSATGGRLKDQRRMIDREVALRFVAFWRHGPAGYAKLGGTMDGFLLNAQRELDDPKSVSDEEQKEVLAAFDRGLSNARLIFGSHAFQKWDKYSDDRKPFNRALFEVWSVELARISTQIAADTKAKIVSAARETMSTDFAYLSSITSSTGGDRAVQTRFSKTARIIAEAAA